MKLFRIIIRSIRDSFKSIFRNFSLSMASIICTTITLILVSIAIIVSVNVNNITKMMEEELTIVVYVEKDTSDEEINSIENKLKRINNVLDVSYKSKEEWRLEMKNYSETLEVTLDYLEQNPLLDSFIVKVKDVNDLSPTTKQIRGFDHIESANYGEGTVEEIITVFNVIRTVTLVIVISLVVVTAFLISNTIKLTIFSRKSEIEIMRLVGSSNIAIKLPFIIEGLFLGFLGSLIPVIITIYGYIILYEKTGGKISLGIMKLVEALPFTLYVGGILIVIGSIVGMLGSSRAVRKYLKI